MNISIIGAGGVGGYFGGRLAQAGHDVTFVARGEHGDVMERSGLKVKSINGDFEVNPVRVVRSTSGIHKPDLILICVKAWQVKEVALELKGRVGDSTLILPLQNGVVASEELIGVLGEENVLAGLCRIISMIESPGIINHVAVDPAIVIGEVGSSPNQRIQKLKQALTVHGIACETPDDIQAALWKKYISICVSALLAVTRTTYGEIMEQPETRTMMRELMVEVHSVATAAGVSINPDFPDRMIAFFDTFPYDSTSSLTRDVMEGRPSEIEYQNGCVVRLGERYGVDTPINRFVYHCILPMERKARELER